MKSGKIDLGKPGLGMGGNIHGGTVNEGVFKTPYPLDTSDHNAGSSEHGKSMSTKATGAAGGYKGSTKGGNAA